MDECFGRDFAEAAASCGVTAIYLPDVLPRGTEDTDWLLHVAENSYVALTKDKEIGTSQLFRRAVILARARVVTFSVGQAGGEELNALVKVIVPKAIRSVGPRRGPCIFKANRLGGVGESRLTKKEIRRAWKSVGA